MLKKIIEKVFFYALWPIRYSVRQELKKLPISKTNDIGNALQNIATSETADYVSRAMSTATSVTSHLELLTIAFNEATVTPDTLVLEFGVYKARTINHIASLTNQKVYGFDSFEGLPERWRDGYDKGVFKLDSLPKVKENVTLVSGWFEDTLPDFAKNHKEKISFLHVDSDIYSSAKTIFETLESHIGPGCIIVFDEYFNYPGWKDGEYKAFQEFIAKTNHKYKYIGYNSTHQQVAVKIL